jgi:hypothetical protein
VASRIKIAGLSPAAQQVAGAERAIPQRKTLSTIRIGILLWITDSRRAKKSQRVPFPSPGLTFG